MDFNLAAVNEAVAAAVPDREAIVWGDRRITYAELAERSRRLANHLLGCGFEVRQERSELDGWESGQDHLALYLHNGNEYLEGMLGAYKARVAPFNVNYRYVAEELRYLLNDSRARGRRLPLGLRAHPRRGPGRAARPRGAAAGARRLGPRPVARRRLVRGRPGRRVSRPATGRALGRRPLHPLHRRHDRHAQGRALAPGRHLPGRARGSPARHDRRVAEPRGAGRERAQRRRPAHAVPTVHARRRALDRVQRLRRRQHHRPPPPHPEPRPGRHLVDDRGRGRQHPAHRGRRVRPTADRRARCATTTTSARC